MGTNRRAAAMLVAAAITLAGCGDGNGTGEGTTLSDGSAAGSLESVCESFTATAPVFLLLAFTDLASADGSVTVTSEGPGVPADLTVLVSPTLLDFYTTLAAYADAEGSDADAEAIATLVDHWADGVEMLRSAGLTDDDLDYLRDPTLWTDGGDDPTAGITALETTEAGMALFPGSEEFAERTAALLDGAEVAVDAEESLLGDLDADCTAVAIDASGIDTDDPCALLGADTLDGLVDGIPGESETDPFGGGVGCTWESDADGPRLAVIVHPTSAWEDFTEIYAPDTPESFATTIDGYGDEAFITSGFVKIGGGGFGQGQRTLFVLDGDRVMSVAYDSTEGSDDDTDEVLYTVVDEVLVNAG